MANLNTVATRQRAAAVLGSVFGGTRGATMELLDKAPFAVVLADDGKIASVCVFEIVPATDDYPTSWGQILFLGTDPKYQAKGYGKTAVAAALHYFQEYADHPDFGCYADTYHQRARSKRLGDNLPGTTYWQNRIGMKAEPEARVAADFGKAHGFYQVV